MNFVCKHKNSKQIFKSKSKNILHTKKQMTFHLPPVAKTLESPFLNVTVFTDLVCP